MMPAQAAIGNPWVLTPHEPTVQQRYELIKNHLAMSIACELQFREAVEQYDHKI